MSSPEGEYYSAERWQNWLDRLDGKEIDFEDEDTARLRMNLQDDAVIAVAKIVTDYDDGALDEDAAMLELEDVEQVVLSEVEFDEEDTRLLVDTVQTALLAVLFAAKEYVAAGPPEGNVVDYLDAAVEAEREDDLDAALGYCAQAGTLIIDGQDLTTTPAEDLEFGRVVEWIDGLESLQEALADPEVIEDDADEASG